LAHWTFTQRTIHSNLAPKSIIFRHAATIKTPSDLLTTSRKEAGLTQEQLSQIVGIHRQWIGRWERNRALPSETDWKKLSTVLNLAALNVTDR
jgi:DNA-binding XRE family transcriptional regulator